MARTPATFDTYEEFRSPLPPIEGGDADPKQMRRREITPYEEGHRYGRNRIEITPAILQTHVKKWQSGLLNKLSVIDGEIRELEKRKGSPLLFLGLLFGLLFGTVGFLIAIAVDYWLVADFWNTVFANEFGEVPENLATSPFIKALQVVVAALALHFLFQYLGRKGKRFFVYTMAFLSIILLLGIGIWVANENLPPGFTMFGVQLTEEVETRDTTLEDLGLAPAQPETAQPAEETADKSGSELLNNALGVTWFLAFGLIFLVVTGVAALSLGVAARAAAGLFGTLDREVYDGRAMNRQDIVFRLERARQARAHLVDGEYRSKILEAYLGDFMDGYGDGLEKSSSRGKGGSNDELMQSYHASAAQALEDADLSDWSRFVERPAVEPDGERKDEGDGESKGGDSAGSGNGLDRDEKPLPDTPSRPGGQKPEERAN
ncbi:MAG: hypothetical protein ACLFV8_04295 [Alphaproteobacteria bacterium]